ncbi:glycosyltransferase family 2 protein, partial [Aeromonas salmonicida]
MKVSVLVPVYNLARFIEPCLLSLLEQKTDFEFEVIAIDDGSSDDSWAILQRLARQWPGLRVLQNKKNIGVC